MDFDLTDILKTAELILSQNPEPVIQYLLYRDIFKFSINSSEIIDSKRELNNNHWVKVLSKEQQEDGSWGPLYSQDSSSKNKIITTEYGVRKSIILGLDGKDEILKRASQNLVHILNTGFCLDRPEKNERWSTGLKLFASSTLSLIHPNHKLVREQQNIWRNIINSTFSSGKYDPLAEKKAHKEFTGIIGELKYLKLNSKYHLELLGSKLNLLHRDIENLYFDWIANQVGSISYISLPLNKPMNEIGLRDLESWLLSMEILSKFNNWIKYSLPGLMWLWKNKDQNGPWNFGTKSRSSVSLFPLSRDWRSGRSTHD